MGQPITVTEKATSQPGVVRFELNRSLTGMGHERYRSVADAVGERPPDVLARRLFERGGVESIHVFSNEVTVVMAPDGSAAGMADMLRELFTHYLPGVLPSIP